MPQDLTPPTENQVAAPNCIVIGENITVSEPFTFAFGGWGEVPVYKAFMTPEEHQTLLRVCQRAIPILHLPQSVSSEPQSEKSETGLPDEPSPENKLLNEG